MSHLEVGEESDPFDLFVFAINAEQTKTKYISRLRKFIEISGIDSEQKTDSEGKMQGINHQSKIRKRMAG